MMLTPIAQPDTREWHAGRSKGIGASESAAAAGLSTYETPLHLYARKRGEAPATEETAAMRLGKRLEPVVIAEFSDLTGLTVAQAPCGLYQHAKHPFVLATPDALLANGELLEAKTTTWRQAEKLGAEGTDEIPVEWLCQSQQQMAVLDVGIVHLAVLLDGRSLKTFRIERNDKLIAGLIEAEADLWERIESGNPPEPDWNHPRTPDLIRAMNRLVSETVIELPDEIAGWWDRYEDAGAVIREHEKDRAEFKARVMAFMGEAGAALLPGGDRMIRRKLTKRDGYTVEPSEYIDVRAVKTPRGVCVT